jgi:acyl-CoA hydrolase
MRPLASSSEFDFDAVLRAGDHIAWPQGTGEPVGLTGRLVAQGPYLPRTTLVLGMVTTPTLDNATSDAFDFLCLNGAANTRKAAARSGNRVIPAHVSAIPGLILSRRIPVDVALIRVRPTDDPDMLSLGVMVDFVHEMVESARIVVAELDERMPLTAQDALIPRSRITHLTIADGGEPLMPDPRLSAADVAVAEQVAALIPNRATVQFGVGGLPTAVCAALRDHRGLGLHSGVIPDAAIALIESGVIDNRHKGIDVGVTVTGGLFGSRRLMDFAHGNPAIAMRRATYTHAIETMLRLPKFYTINSAIEIDITGQVNAEMAGSRYVGAVGGQIDYVRGGRLSAGGRSIIAMSSTTPDEKHSKIVARLAGRPVTTARSDIDMVVTEYGVADLWGVDLHARAAALIAIAHPAFRDQLHCDFEEALTQNA